jgi:Fic family protein
MSTNGITTEITNLANELADLPELTEERRNQLEKKIRLEFHYNSNHLEGNTLTYSETELLLVFDETRGTHSLREYEEMKASDVALEMIKDLANAKAEISETFIKNLNEVLLVRPYYKEAITRDGQRTKRRISIGEYKSHPNSVLLDNGEIFEYTPPHETPAKMGELIFWLKERIEKKDMHPVELAALFHYKFVRIHPFDDGNGRISRLLMNYVLLFFNYPPVIIKSEDKRNYLNALHDADTGNIDSFINYIGRQLIWSLKLYCAARSGESIEEKKDWVKKIEVLKRKIEQNAEIKLRKTPRVIEEVINTRIIPTIFKVLDELKPITEMFISNTFSISTDSSGSFQIPSVETKLSKPSINEHFDKHANLRILLADFKNPDRTFSVLGTIKTTFDTLRYTFTHQNTVILNKLYHQELDEFDIEILTETYGKFFVEKIELEIGKFKEN